MQPELQKDAFMGVLMLDTRFPRHLGDIGNPDTFPFPVRYKMVRFATPEVIVFGNSGTFLPAFTDAARELEHAGATLLTTSCGFLAPFQDALSDAVSVPVLTSSLHLYQSFQREMPPGKRVAILTIASSQLTLHHLKAAGIPKDTPIGTMEGSREFAPSILENRTSLNLRKSEAEIVRAAKRLVREEETVGGILMECTNMAPHAKSVERAIGLPTRSINDGLIDYWSRKQKT